MRWQAPWLVCAFACVLAVLLVCCLCEGFVRVDVKEDLLPEETEEEEGPRRRLLGSVSGGSSGYETPEQDKPFDLNPVILVPGLMGSALETKVTSPSNCAGLNDWKRTWVALNNLWGGQCWMSNLFRTFDPSTGNFIPREGVDTRVIDFGGVKGMDFLGYAGGYAVPGTGYMVGLVQKLVSIGYTVGSTLRGAPYDWRSTPSFLETSGYYQNLKNLVEETHRSTGRRVHLIVHSMGAPYTIYFLNKVVTPAWKEEHIANMISLSGAFAGAPEALRAVLSGDSDSFLLWGLHLLDPLNARMMESSGGGFHFLIPFQPPGLPSDAVWPDSEVLGSVTFPPPTPTPTSSEDGTSPQTQPQPQPQTEPQPQPQPHTQTFSQSQLDGLVQLAGESDAKKGEETQMLGANMLKLWGWMRGAKTSPHQYIRDPGVPLYCLYGDGMQTERSYSWGSPDFDMAPQVGQGNGDGTVPDSSLRVCHHWGSTAYEDSFPGVGHTDMLNNAGVLARVENILRITAHMGRPSHQGSGFIVWFSVILGILFVALVGVAIVQQLANRRMRRVVENAGGYINMNAIGMVHSHRQGPQPFSLSQKYPPFSEGYEGGDL